MGRRPRASGTIGMQYYTTTEFFEAGSADTVHKITALRLALAPNRPTKIQRVRATLTISQAAANYTPTAVLRIGKLDQDVAWATGVASSGTVLVVPYQRNVLNCWAPIGSDYVSYQDIDVVASLFLPASGGDVKVTAKIEAWCSVGAPENS